MIYDEEPHVKIFNAISYNEHAKYYLNQAVKEYGFERDGEIYTTDFLWNGLGETVIVRVHNRRRMLDITVKPNDEGAMGFDVVSSHCYVNEEDSDTTDSKVIDIQKYLKR